MRNVIYFLFLLFVGFSSCRTPKEKLQHLIKKNPELLRDTVLIDYDTTIIDIPAVHSDSVIHINTFKTDTFIMEKEHLRVQTIYRNDSVFITGDCFGIKDTIVSVEEIHTKYVVNQEKGFEWWKWLVVAFIVYLVIKEYRSWKVLSR